MNKQIPFPANAPRAHVKWCACIDLFSFADGATSAAGKHVGAHAGLKENAPQQADPLSRINSLSRAQSIIKGKQREAACGSESTSSLTKKFDTTRPFYRGVGASEQSDCVVIKIADFTGGPHLLPVRVRRAQPRCSTCCSALGQRRRAALPNDD